MGDEEDDGKNELQFKRQENKSVSVYFFLCYRCFAVLAPWAEGWGLRSEGEGEREKFKSPQFV